jgi:hypothetical protein
MPGVVSAVKEVRSSNNSNSKLLSVLSNESQKTT